jgi:hypothetical protein
MRRSFKRLLERDGGHPGQLVERADGRGQKRNVFRFCRQDRALRYRHEHLGQAHPKGDWMRDGVPMITEHALKVPVPQLRLDADQLVADVEHGFHEGGVPTRHANRRPDLSDRSYGHWSLVRSSFATKFPVWPNEDAISAPQDCARSCSLTLVMSAAIGRRPRPRATSSAAHTRRDRSVSVGASARYFARHPRRSTHQSLWSRLLYPVIYCLTSP